MKKALLTLFFAIASRSYAVEFGDIPADYTLYSAGDPFAIALATNNAAVKMNINNGTSTNQTLRLPLVADHLSFSLGTAPALGAGEIAWDPDWLTFKAGLSNGVEGQFFQEHHIVAKNAWTNTIPNGWIVMHSGVVGNSGKYEVVPAISTPALDPTRVIGMTTEDIPVGALGRITARGNVNQIGSDGSLYGASGWQNNTAVYLCTTHVGWVTTNIIQAPYPRVYIGNIVRAHTSGAIYIRVQPGLRLSELDDVDGTPLTSTGQIPVWDNGRQVFDFNRNVNEFLLASAFGTWTSTNTYVKTELDQTALAALAAFAATNRVTSWRDTENSNILWTAVSGSELLATLENAVQTNTNYVVVTFSENFRNNFNQPYPDVAVTNTYGSTFNNGYWSFFTPGSETWLITFSHPEEAVYWQSEGLAVPATLTSPIGGSGYAYVNWLTYTTNIVTRYTLTTGNVWQAVSSAQDAAEAAQMAADQAETLINYHTTLDAAPHAGKFAPAAITNAITAPYRQWTGTITPIDGTATVTYAVGNMPSLAITSNTVLAIDGAGFATSGVSRVSLSVYSGTNSLTVTNAATFMTAPTLSTNTWNTLLLRRVSDGSWKGAQL